MNQARPKVRLSRALGIPLTRKCLQPPFQLAAAGAHAPDGPTAPYLSVSLDQLHVTLIREPARREVPIICDEQLVVEYYSR